MTTVSTSSFRWINVVKVAGAWISFCIGSGFATGQELLQYFCAYGKMSFGTILIAMLLHGYSSATFLKLGKNMKFAKPLDVFDYYCGPTFGKLFKLLSIFFLFLSPVVMIAGFGAALNQYFSIPTLYGNSIMGILAIVTVVLGLRRMVEIIGAIGPVIIAITLLAGGIYLAQHSEGLLAGFEIAPQIQTLKMGTNWLISGILYAAWAPMISAPFLVAAAATVDTEKEAAWGGILGTVFYGLACVVMVLAFFTNYAEISQQPVPTLYLSHSIAAILGYSFLAVIFLGIYSSAVPSLFTFCATFQQEKTAAYNIFTVVIISVATVVSIVMPFGSLLNVVYTVYGYLGMLFFVLMIIKQIRGVSKKTMEE